MDSIYNARVHPTTIFIPLNQRVVSVLPASFSIVIEFCSPTLVFLSSQTFTPLRKNELTSSEVSYAFISFISFLFCLESGVSSSSKPKSTLIKYSISTY